MRRDNNYQHRDDEPTRPVRVPRLRLSQETGKTLKITLEPNDLATSDASAQRTAR
jgi:hypothetical protein